MVYCRVYHLHVDTCIFACTSFPKSCITVSPCIIRWCCKHYTRMSDIIFLFDIRFYNQNIANSFLFPVRYVYYLWMVSCDMLSVMEVTNARMDPQPKDKAQHRYIHKILEVFHKIIKHVTVEPVIFFYAVGFGITTIISSSLYFDKICKVCWK